MLHETAKICLFRQGIAIYDQVLPDSENRATGLFVQMEQHAEMAKIAAIIYPPETDVDIRARVADAALDIYARPVAINPRS